MKVSIQELKCPNCQKVIPNPKKGYKVQLSTSDDGYTYSTHSFVVCSSACREEMSENIRNLMKTTNTDCYMCSEPGIYICSIMWLPITFEFCSIICMQSIENILNEQQRDPIYNLIHWAKEKNKRNA